MNFYCVTFYALIEESLIFDGYEYGILSNISMLPHMKKNDAQKLLNAFKKMGQTESISTIESDRARLRKILRGRK